MGLPEAGFPTPPRFSQPLLTFQAPCPTGTLRTEETRVRRASKARTPQWGPKKQGEVQVTVGAPLQQRKRARGHQCLVGGLGRQPLFWGERCA